MANGVDPALLLHFLYDLGYVRYPICADLRGERERQGRGEVKGQERMKGKTMRRRKMRA